MSEVNYQKWRKQISLHHYRDELLKRPRYQQEKRLIRFGYKVYSQSDEDGVLREIFARIGVAAGHFVEIGVETGVYFNGTGISFTIFPFWGRRYCSNGRGRNMASG